MIGARPKSEKQPSSSGLRRTFVDLMFPCVNLPPPSEWIWAMPRAAPSEIFTLEPQSNGVRSLLLFAVLVILEEQREEIGKIVNSRATRILNKRKTLNFLQPFDHPYACMYFTPLTQKNRIEGPCF